MDVFVFFCNSNDSLIGIGVEMGLFPFYRGHYSFVWKSISFMIIFSEYMFEIDVLEKVSEFLTLGVIEEDIPVFHSIGIIHLIYYELGVPVHIEELDTEIQWSP